MATPARSLNGEHTAFGRRATLTLNLVKQSLVAQRLGPPPTPEPVDPEASHRRGQVQRAMAGLREREREEQRQERIARGKRRIERLEIQEAIAETRASILAQTRAALASDAEKEAFLAAKAKAYAPGPIRKPEGESPSDESSGWDGVSAAMNIAERWANL